MNVALVLDSSGSMGVDGWKVATKFAADFLDRMDHARSTVVSFSSPNALNYRRCKAQYLYKANTGKDAARYDPSKCGLKVIKKPDDPRDDEQIVDSTWMKHWTWTGPAVSTAVATMERGKPDGKSNLVVVIDGQPNDAFDPQPAMKKAREEGITVSVVVVKNKEKPKPVPDLEDLRSSVSEPAEDHVIVLDEYQELKSIATFNRLMSMTCSDGLV